MEIRRPRQKTLDKSFCICYNIDTEREVMIMRQQEEFMKKYADFKAGRITPKEWDNYCIKCLIALLEKNPNMVIK